MPKNYIFLAVKNIRNRGIRSLLTMLGIFLGIAAVVSLISLGDGLENSITGQFSSLSADRLIITNAETGFGPPGSTAVKKLTPHDLDLIKSVNRVKIAIPRLIRIVKFEFNRVSDFEFIGSIPEDEEQLNAVYDTFGVKIGEGRLLEREDRGKIILGNDFLKTEKFGRKLAIGSKVKIQEEEFEIIGFLKKAQSFQVNSIILMSEEDLRRILSIKEDIDAIAVQTDSIDITEDVAKRIEDKLRKDRRLKSGEEDFSVQTLTQVLDSINSVINVVNLVVAGIAAISLLVGGIGIANTMFTSVLERRKDIGVMKAIGAKNSDILSIYIIESSILGLIGGIVGAIIGLSLAFAVSSIAGSFLGGIELSVKISLPLVLGSILFSLVVGVISGIIPALQASKMNPVEALRK